ncbi:MAG: hypothetical protein HZB92_00530 [Euryarchaeota archaeon]|nr:hypothetical protein [Euryarchaeota archaeon]
MAWFEIYSADVLGSYRSMRKRVSNNSLYALWSVALAIFSIAAVVWIIAFIARSQDALAFPLALNDVLFLVFMILFGKGMFDAYHLLVERPATVFLLTQPLRPGSVIAGKAVAITVLNLALVAFVLGSVTAMTFLGRSMHFVIPPFLVADITILTMLASSAGLAYAVLSGLSTWRRKLVAGALYSPVMSSVYVAMSQLKLDGWALTMALLVIYLISLCALPACSFLLLEAWNTMTSSKANAHPSKRERGRSRLYALIEHRVGVPATAVLEMEVRTLLRRREGIGNAITIVGFIGFAFYMYGRLGAMVALSPRIAGLLPPMIVAMSIFIAANMLCLVSALGAFSKDGKAAWVVRVSPVSEEKVVRGKALSVMLMAPFIVAFVAVPLPLLAGLSWYSVLFAALGALAICATQTGLGLWFGARYPNFDEAHSNSPDVMTMYTVMLISLVACCALLIPPFALALSDKILGLLGLILAVDISFGILLVGMRGATRSYRNMEVAN